MIAATAANILYVSYPLLTVSDESAGGAEQMLWVLEREMWQRGITTAVAASSGSRVSGELLVTGAPCSQPDDFERRNREHQDRVIALIQERSREGSPFDLVHDESGSFWTRAAEVDVPVLATLHLPRHFYPDDAFLKTPENLRFNCVSHSQAQTFTDLQRMVGVVANGIALDRFMATESGTNGVVNERSGLLWLGRICEEKAPHLALEIAGKAGLPITLAGQVYPFSYHQNYYQREILPRMQNMPNVQWVDSPSFTAKLEFLKTASALLITSQVDETSSLVAMEAAACGTPVIAFSRGALPEVVTEGVTGYIVNDVFEALAVIKKIGGISSLACQQHARKNFSGGRMADQYAKLYGAIISEWAGTTLSQLPLSS